MNRSSPDPRPAAAAPAQAARELAQLLREVASLDDAAALIEAFARAQAIEAVGRYQERMP
ncbi:KN motif and ankyrin repeat domain-containing protein 3 (Ankyrin repeat domain-containing protein 47) (fragment) [Bradyrhizobium sp. STM 3843]|uniref:hypothetical protein n=1 Tax=Bradyrhizobium sp. STM 3843 TaxID=551947 RepID=UPI0002407132